MTPIRDVLEAASAAEAAGHWDTALAIYQEALEEWEPVGGAPTCDLLRKIGLVHYHRGDFEIALNLFSSSQRLAMAAGSSRVSPFRHTAFSASWYPVVLCCCVLWLPYTYSHGSSVL